MEISCNIAQVILADTVFSPPLSSLPSTALFSNPHSHYIQQTITHDDIHHRTSLARLAAFEKGVDRALSTHVRVILECQGKAASCHQCSSIHVNRYMAIYYTMPARLHSLSKVQHSRDNVLHQIAMIGLTCAKPFKSSMSTIPSIFPAFQCSKC